VHSAATIAGMAFANAFLGICHSVSPSFLALECLALPLQSGRICRALCACMLVRDREVGLVVLFPDS